MDSSSRARSAFGRRDVLRLFALTPVAAAAISACSTGAKEPDELAALVRAARSDAKLAQEIARSHADLSNTATLVASTRTEHARALQREIDRVDPPDPDDPADPAPATPKNASSSGEATNALREALRSAQEKSAGITPSLPTYRAGLVGSVSASCACLLEVLG